MTYGKDWKREIESRNRDSGEEEEEEKKEDLKKWIKDN